MARLQTLSLSLQTLYAELVQQSLDAAFDDDFPENGTFTARTRSGRKYWYYEGYKTSSGGKTDAQKYTKYAGPHDDPEITRRVEEFRRNKTSFRERRRLVTTLRDAGLPVPPTLVGDIVEVLWKAGIFRLRGVLVGTLAYQTYAGLLGIRLSGAALMTGDVDFAQFYAISAQVEDHMPPMLDTLRSIDPTFRARPNLDNRPTAYVNEANFSVEFLTPNRGSEENAGKPADMPTLGGASAQSLRYLDFLIKDPVRTVLLHKAGIPVTVPAPERFAVHKLIVSELRKDDDNGAAKASKDAVQAGQLTLALVSNARQADLGFAWMEAWDRGPHWRERLAGGLRRLGEEENRKMQEAIAEACNHDGRSPTNYAP